MGRAFGHWHRGSQTAAQIGDGSVHVLLQREPQFCHVMSPGQLGVGGGDGGGGVGHETRVYTSQLTGQLLSALVVPHSPSPSQSWPTSTSLQFLNAEMVACEVHADGSIASTQQDRLMLTLVPTLLAYFRSSCFNLMTRRASVTHHSPLAHGLALQIVKGLGRSIHGVLVRM